MQKKLIALAVASLVSSGAFAQSNVTIWGVVDLAIESGKYSDAAGNLTRMVPSGTTTNRLGFKGTEDLGNGLSANWVLETQANPDNGTQAAAQFWNRQAYVGLSGKTWGSVNMGRQYTPWFSSFVPSDVFYVAGAGSSYVLQVGDTRMNNAIRWDSVNMNGFSFAVMVGLGQDADGTGAEGTTNVPGVTNKKMGREHGLKISYANGPINVNYGYDNQTTSVGTAGIGDDTRRNQLNGSYDFKVVKLGLGWNTAKKDGAQDDQVWTLTAVMPVMGKDLVKIGYTRLNNRLAGVVNGDARLIAIGYEHPMSKRTNLYATYAKMDNDSGAARTVLGGVGVAAGFDPSVFQVGLRHSF